MKKTFKQYLLEYDKKEMPQSLSIDQLKKFLEFENNQETIKLKDNIQLNLYKLDSRHNCLMIKSNDKIIGYVMMHIFENTKYWQISSINLYSNKQEGIGTLIYEKLLNIDYILINGTSLSISAEKIWKKLIHKYNSGTFDKIENKIYQLDNRPTDDKGSTNSYETNQRYFWIISKDKLNYFKE
jgi:hypothetical protein